MNSEVERSDGTNAPLDRVTVVRLAGDLLDEDGLDGFRLGEIADRAGVTQPALYRHIDSVADLWRALGLATRAELADTLIDASLGVAGDNAVRAVSHAWRTYALDHPGRYRSTERFPVAGDAELEASVQRVIDVLAAALRGFDLDENATLHGALLLRSTLHGYVSFELGDGNPGPHHADETFEVLVNALCQSFDA